jgi:hypothetical protein
MALLKRAIEGLRYVAVAGKHVAMWEMLQKTKAYEYESADPTRYRFMLTYGDDADAVLLAGVQMTGRDDVCVWDSERNRWVP